MYLENDIQNFHNKPIYLFFCEMTLLAVQNPNSQFTNHITVLKYLPNSALNVSCKNYKGSPQILNSLTKMVFLRNLPK
jgi:hypothetical protein